MSQVKGKTVRAFEISVLERSVVERVLQGDTDEAAAKNLNLSVEIVQQQLQVAITRAGARDRAHLISMAFQRLEKLMLKVLTPASSQTAKR